jgi:hypothetical protein
MATKRSPGVASETHRPGPSKPRVGGSSPSGRAQQPPVETEERSTPNGGQSATAGQLPQRGPDASDVIQFGPRASGARSCAVTLEGGLRVLVEPSEEGQNADAIALARRIVSGEAALSAAKEEALAATARTERLAARVRELEAANTAGLTGRRRFFGPVLMKPVASGDWVGPILLLDPEKKERGQALIFSTLAEVRAVHPELWVIGTTVDGVLLDAWGAS